MLECCVCRGSYLHSCFDFSASEVRTLKKRGCTWSCRNCNAVSNDINQLRSAILSLKDEIRSSARSAINDTIFEEILSELSDREGRKQNIILYNVAESGSQDQAERRGHDLATVKSILVSLPLDVDVERVDPHRLGRPSPDPSRIRPIKIRLLSVSDAHKVVRSAKHLKASNDFKSVRISLDKTKRQTEYYKKVKTELDARVASGETGLRIKYRRGLPTIENLN